MIDQSARLRYFIIATLVLGGQGLVLSSSRVRAENTAIEETMQVAWIDPAVCRWLVEHRPDASVAYQPDVNVHGHPVVPVAVAGAFPMSLPSKIAIPVTMDMAPFLKGLSLGGLEAKAMIGQVTMGEGGPRFNNQPLAGQSDALVRALCERLGVSTGSSVSVPP
jgi:hypothetical protein